MEKEKKSLYIFGNGFDLNLGLPTEYNDYFEYTGFNKIKEELKNIMNIDTKILDYKFNFKKYKEIEIFYYSVLEHKYKILKSMRKLNIDVKSFEYAEKFEKIDKFSLKIKDYIEKCNYTRELHLENKDLIQMLSECKDSKLISNNTEGYINSLISEIKIFLTEIITKSVVIATKNKKKTYYRNRFILYLFNNDRCQK